MNLEFDVQMNAGVLYDYMLRHTYSGIAGILGSVAGALGVVAGMLTHYPLYWILGLVILVYQPVSLWLRAKQQALLPVFKEPLHYKMTEEGVRRLRVKQNSSRNGKICIRRFHTGKSVILYTDRIHASIFPRKDLETTDRGNRGDMCAYAV